MPDKRPLCLCGCGMRTKGVHGVNYLVVMEEMTVD